VFPGLPRPPDPPPPPPTLPEIVPPGVTGYDGATTIPPAPPPPAITRPPPPPPPITKALTAVVPAGTENEKGETEVKEVITGALTVMLNDLVDVCLVVAADTVNVDVVFEATALAVPVIAAVDVFKDNPVGKEPDVIEYVIVSPSASVAAALDSE
jgi:hypothetical protein